MQPAPHIHNLSHNKAEHSPQHLIIVDTETTWSRDDNGESHTLRLWCAQHIHRHDKAHKAAKLATAEGKTRQSLADQVNAWCKHAASTWLYCHNTSFDLSVSNLPVELAHLGWELSSHAITSPRPWLRLRRKGHALTIADSSSVLPRSLEDLGNLLGIPKLELPAQEDREALWRARCHGDVEILAAAMTQIMDWWDQGKHGYWSLSGPACGWNAFRHIRMPLTVTIDPDPVARKFERSAVIGGRREAWHIGRLPTSRYTEIDFTQAHLTVCRRFPLPVKRIRRFEGDPPEYVWLNTRHAGILAEVTVHTATPRYPVSLGGRIWHPIGTFKTTLAGPEIVAARNRGDLIKVHHGYIYRLGPSMQWWAVWIEELLANAKGEAPPMALVAAKAWSRTVPGKWATLTSQVTQRLPSHVTTWNLERGVAHPQNAPSSILHFNGEQTWNVHDQEAQDSFPAVLAWIQSYVRVALANVIDEIGEENMVSCNTDGIICRYVGPRQLQRLAEIAAPFVPRIKATYRKVEIISPNHLVLGGVPRLSGVPASATPLGDKSWQWLTWPNLKKTIQGPPQAGYRRVTRNVSLKTCPISRWVLSDSSTTPPYAHIGSDGETQLSPWVRVPKRAQALSLAPEQHPYLTGLDRSLNPPTLSVLPEPTPLYPGTQGTDQTPSRQP